MSWTFYLLMHRDLLTSQGYSSPIFDESSPKLHTVKPIMKRIHPFYLNREGGVTRPLNVLRGMFRLIIVIPKLDVTR